MAEALFALVAVFAPYSLSAFGGGMSVVAGIQHQAVDVYHWATAQEFIGLFAISRAAPGPGSMLATLIGFQAAGWAGAVVATAAMFAPSSILCACVASLSRRHRDKAWLKALEQAAAPLGAGLAIAGVLSVAELAFHSVLPVATFAAATLIVWLRPKLNLVLIILGGALIGAAGAAIGL